MNNEPTMKAMVRDLTPPLVWKLLRRMIASPSAVKEVGSERSSDYYDEKYSRTEEYHRHYADSPYFFLWCVLIDRLRPIQVRCLFDIGCGPGQFAAFLHDRGLAKYVGMDFSAECIHLAHAACPSFEFVCANAYTSELFSTLDYDVVVATEFLEHVEGDLAIIDRIKLGTRVYASVPNFPNTAHVRHFSSSEEVCARYGAAFADFRVDEFLFGSGGLSLFLFEGVRVARRSQADCHED